MHLFFSILMDTLIIWSRSFPLVYGVLFFFLLLGAILPQAETPSWEWRWMLLLAVVILLVSAFMAGWANMIVQACVRFYQPPASEQPRTPGTQMMEGFRLFKAFFPGVGQFFPSVTVAVLIQTAVLVGMVLWLQPLWSENLPVLERVLQSGANTQAEMMAALSETERLSLGTLGLALIGALVFYAVFGLLTLLWLPFILMYGDSALKAYWRSVVQFFKDPIRLILLSGTLLAIQLGFNLMVTTSGPVWGIVFHFLGLLSQIYFAVAIFVYAYRVIGPPTTQLETAIGTDEEQQSSRPGPPQEPPTAE